MVISFKLKKKINNKLMFNKKKKKILVLKMIWELLLVTKLVNFLYCARDQITSLLVNLDKNGIVFVMDSGKL